MTRVKITVGLICIFLAPLSRAEASENPWIEVIARDFGAATIAPLKLRKNPIVVGALATVGSILIFSVDDKIDDHYSGSHDGGLFQMPRGMNRIGEIYDTIGSRNFVAATAGTIALGGLITGQNRYVRTGGICVEAFVFTKLYTSVLKRTIGRARPYTEEGSRTFSPLSMPNRDDQSMPSGHTSGIFSIATVVAERHPSWWIRIPAYFFAASVAVQRMDSRNHWASDTLVGAALGYGVGRTLVSRHEAPSRSIRGARFQPNPGGLGLTLGF